jgi:hypothetical protein
MENTPILNLPLVMPSQMQQFVTHNEALTLLDGITQLSVIARTLTTAPAGAAEGDRYIVAAGADGDWAGWEPCIALRADGEWRQIAPGNGWLAWVQAENVLLAWDGTTWTPVSGAGSDGNFPTLGVNALPDSTNRMAVKSDAALFSHDDITPGSGDIRITANKAAAGNTASFLFQDGWSGRAEFGLAGDDDLHIKVSADGTTWKDALIVNRSTGVVSMPFTSSGGSLSILTAEDTAGTSMPSNTYVDQTFGTTSRNDFGSSAWNGTTFTAPTAGVYDFSAVLGVDGIPTSTSMYFYKNGSTMLGFNEIVGNSGQNTILCRTVLALATGDTMTVRMRHNGPSTQPGLTSAVFSIVRLG